MSKEKITPQEILIAYCSTLSDKRAKEAYQILLERFEIHKARCLTFDRYGKECPPPQGKIRLTPSQLEKILNEYGEIGFHSLCEILYDYIVNLEERAPYEVIARRRLKEYQKISHFYKLTNGWVAEKYAQAHPEVATINEKEPLRYELISNKAQAIEWIKSIPSELRFNTPEIPSLIMQYNIKDGEI